MEGERDRLRSHVSEMEGVQEAVDGEVAQLRGRLGAEETRSRALEASRREVCLYHPHHFEYIPVCLCGVLHVSSLVRPTRVCFASSLVHCVSEYMHI